MTVESGTMSERSLEDIRRDVTGEGQSPPIQQAPQLRMTDIDLQRREVAQVASLPRVAEQGTSKVTEFIRSLKALKGREVTVAVRKKQGGLSQAWAFKTSESVDYENFVMENLMLSVGQTYGNGKYQFTFTIKREDGSIEDTFSFQEDIDLSEREVPKQERSVEVPQVVRKDDSSAVLMAFMEKMDSRFSSMLEVIKQQGENRQVAAIERLEAAVTKQQQPTQLAVPQSNMSEMIEGVIKMVGLSQKLNPASATVPQNPVEVAQQFISVMRSGYDAATAMYKPMLERVAAMDAPEVSEGEDKPKGFMDVIQNIGTNVFSTVLKGIADRYTGATPAPGLESQPTPSEDAAIALLRQALGQSAQFFAQGKQPAEIANWLRGAIPPMHIPQLSSMPVDSVIKEVPALAAHKMALAETLTFLKPRAMPQPRPTRPQPAPQAPAPQSAPIPQPAPKPAATSAPASVSTPAAPPVRIVSPAEIRQIPNGDDGLPAL
jgi:hypothetical protein